MKPGKGSKENSAAYSNHVIQLVDQLMRRYKAEMTRLLPDHPYTDIRRSHHKVLLMLPASGASITELAALAGMTKQSLGELVDGLQTAGYVTSTENPTDRRVRLIQPTERGRAAATLTRSAGDEIEATWRATVGRDRYDQMKATLEELVQADLGVGPVPH
jgi:DNA-binding MarR family transcriptional regulator